MSSERTRTAWSEPDFPGTGKPGYVWKYLLPVILWMLVIFASSSIPADQFPKVKFWVWPKLVHLFFYIVLCFLVHRALTHQTRYPRLAVHSFFFAILIALLYGATDEFHQLFTPGRHGSISDVLIDGFGACLCIAAMTVKNKFITLQK